MKTLTVKGHQIPSKITKSGTDRKAVLFANNIIEELKQINIPRDNIEIKTNVLGGRNVLATIEFWAEGHYCRFSYSLTNRFIDNLYIIMKLIEIEVKQVLTGEKDILEFYHTFTENEDRKDISKNLKQAKLDLNLDEDESDLEIINKSYKKLAIQHHPDKGGNVDEFKKINKAHKLIKKEMGL